MILNKNLKILVLNKIFLKMWIINDLQKIIENKTNFIL